MTTGPALLVFCPQTLSFAVGDWHDRFDSKNLLVYAMLIIIIIIIIMYLPLKLFIADERLKWNFSTAPTWPEIEPKSLCSSAVYQAQSE